MSGISLIDRLQGVVPGREFKCCTRVPLSIQRHTCQRLPMIVDGNRTRCRQPVFAGDLNADRGPRVSPLIGRLCPHRRLRGSAPRAIRASRQRGYCQSDPKSCNCLQPQTAAQQTSHVHLLQISRKDGEPPSDGSLNSLYPAGPRPA